jgi:hypothetical protein
VAVTIREAKPGEGEHVLAMYEWLFARPGSKPWQWDPERARERLSEAIASPRSAILVAEDRGALIAFCTAYPEFNSVRFGRRCWVEDFAGTRSGGHRGLGRRS